MAKRLPVLSLLFLIVIWAGCGERQSAERTAKGAAARNWISFDKGMALAEREKKPVIIDFYTSWCKWCDVMDKQTFSKPEIEKYLTEHFVTIRIDAEDNRSLFKYRGGEYTPIELTRWFGVRAFPSLAYLDKEGNLVTVVPGYVPPETFMPLLHYMEKECYKKQMTFEEYMKRKGEC